MRLWAVAIALVCLALTSAAPAEAPARPRVVAIVFAEGVVDRATAAKWPDFVLRMGAEDPFATFDDQGMTLHGLRCTPTDGRTSACHLFMAMQPLESRARFCAILPDRGPAPASWPSTFACPTEIKFVRRD